MKKFRKNNKGFTLVELIIVIAILGVLTVAVAPQYLKYVEKSREASDLNAIQEVINVMNVVVADPDNTALKDGDVTLKVASGKVQLVDGTPATGVVAKIQGTPATGGGAAAGGTDAVPGMIEMPKIQSKDGEKVQLTIGIELAGRGVYIKSGSLADLSTAGTQASGT